MSCAVGLSQTVEYPVGKIIKSIQIDEEKNESLALYLPQNFEQAALSPIIFIFDPGGRGDIGIKPFIQAAEKYNYILVCSNNAKNGPYAPNLQIADRLFKYIFSHFNIDQSRIYASGFSGGARLASTIAVLSGAMQGVIACGAGFSKNPLHLPTKTNNFSYVVLIGDRDMNYQEMIKTQKWLSSMAVENDLLLSGDDHRWPSPIQIERAVDWLELLAYKKGISTQAETFMLSNLKAELKLVDSLKQNNMIVHATEEYKRSIANYSPYFELDSIQTKVDNMIKTKAYREGLRDRNKVSKIEDTLSLNYLEKFKKEEALGRNNDDFKWWKKQIKKLDENYVQSEKEFLRKMGERLRYQLFALAIESFNIHIRNNDLLKAQYCGDFLLIQQPKNPYFHYRLARGYASINQVDKALFHLEMSFENGWDNKSMIQNTDEFRRLASNARYKKLMDAN